MKIQNKNTLIILVLSASIFGCSLLRITEPIPYASLKNERIVTELYSKLKLDKSNIGIRYKLVRIFTEELMFFRAIEQLKAIVLNKPDETHAYQMLSLLYLQKHNRDLESAISTLEEALGINPTADSVRANLALLYIEAKQNDKSMHECKFILAQSKDLDALVSAHLILASIKQSQGNESEAQIHYNAAIAIDPTVANQDSTITIPVNVNRNRLFDYIPGSHPDSIDRANQVNELLR